MLIPALSLCELSAAVFNPSFSKAFPALTVSLLLGATIQQSPASLPGSEQCESASFSFSFSFGNQVPLTEPISKYYPVKRGSGGRPLRAGRRAAGFRPGLSAAQCPATRTGGWRPAAQRKEAPGTLLSCSRCPVTAALAEGPLRRPCSLISSISAHFV